MPAAGLLGLRFVFLPLTIRSMRRSMTDETRAAAAVAADATVASAGIATALLVIATAIGLFLAAIYLPDRISADVIGATPIVLLTLLITAPPTFVARAEQCDGARRVFARPTLAVLVTFISYFVGLGIAAALISVTFVIASDFFT
ncbi:MAG: hypothetical protein SGJ11_17315 [Phycisphaerae bacterium]|nr:hypothetical protein [Phycisphaerae bacterium]